MLFSNSILKALLKPSDKPSGFQGSRFRDDVRGESSSKAIHV